MSLTLGEIRDQITTALTHLAGMASAQQQQADVLNGPGRILIKPTDCILGTGAPMALFVDGDDGTPGLYVGEDTIGVRWNDHATPEAIAFRAIVDETFDNTAVATLKVYCSKVGATADNTATLDITAINQELAALHNADSDYGDTTAEIGDPEATSRTIQVIELELAAENLPAGPAGIAFTITPTAGTLDDDDLIIHFIVLEFTRKAAS